VQSVCCILMISTPTFSCILKGISCFNNEMYVRCCFTKHSEFRESVWFFIYNITFISFGFQYNGTYNLDWSWFFFLNFRLNPPYFMGPWDQELRVFGLWMEETASRYEG
jgi:hypothetical protein